MNDVNNNYSLFIFIPLISMISVMFINALLIINDDFITDNDNDNIIDSYNRIVINITIFIKFILSIFINISLFIINYIKFILPIFIKFILSIFINISLFIFNYIKFILPIFINILLFIFNYINIIKQFENNNIHDLNKQLETKDKIIDDLKNKLEDKDIIIDDLNKQNKEINKCSICLINNISICCIPCGHTYCNYCINKTNNCYICRSNIINKIKIYI